MRLRTLQQNSLLHQLLAEAELVDEKTALAKQFSNGRTMRTSELSISECEALNQHLAAGLGRLATAPTIEQEEASDKMRRKIISLAHEMRWVVTATGKADMARINTWCQTRGFGKKVLNQYTVDELRKLVSQFKIMHQKYMDELAKTPPPAL